MEKDNELTPGRSNEPNEKESHIAHHARPNARRDFLIRGAAGAVVLAGMSACSGETTSVRNAEAGPAAEPQFNQGGQGGLRGVFDGQTPETARVSQGKKLRNLMARKGVVLAVLGTPDAGTAQLMDAAGVEAAFIGTSILFGRYGALPDTGVVTTSESIWAAKYIAEACNFPLILDGDTGHGGPPAVRRLVHECIKIGLGGIRIDDQEIEAKRSTGSGGIMVVPREQAIERYKAAVAAKNELDPDFVIMAQCYAREAGNGGMDELLARLPLYESAAGCDWVQFTRPKSIDEIKRARAVVKGHFSAMQGDLPKALTIKEHAELGLNAKWATGWPGSVMTAAARKATDDYKANGPDFILAQANTRQR